MRAHNASAAPRSNSSEGGGRRLDDGTASSVSSSTQSSSQRFRVQQLLRQALSRSPSSRSVPQAGPPQDRYEGARLSGGPKVPSPASAPARLAAATSQEVDEWPAAAEDAQRRQAFERAVAQFRQSVAGSAVGPQVEACRGRALAAVQGYQNYLRVRQAEVGERLRAHKERYREVLLTLVPAEDWSTWAIINGAQPLITAQVANPFDAPAIIEFLQAQKGHKEALENIIRAKIRDIVRSHGDGLSQSRCRELLITRAHTEMVQLDLILFYLEMTALTRAQLAAIRERAQLEQFYSWRCQRRA